MAMGSLIGKSSFPPRITPVPDDFMDHQDLDKWSGAQLSDDQVRALAIGGWYAYSWSSFHDTVHFSPEPVDEAETRRELSIDGLKNWWGVTSAEEAADTIDQLHAGMHSASYELIRPLVLRTLADPDTSGLGKLASEHRDFLRHLANFRGHTNIDSYVRDYDAWLQANKLGLTRHLPAGPSSDIVAWDLVRAVFVVRAAVTAGYFGEDKAWSFLMAGLEIAQRHYRNWHQLGEAYLTGHCFWESIEDLSAAQDASRRRRTSLIRLWERPQSPWRRVALHPGTPIYGFSPFH